MKQKNNIIILGIVYIIVGIEIFYGIKTNSLNHDALAGLSLIISS